MSNQDIRTNFLNHLQAVCVSDKERYRRLDIETVDSLCELYTDCVHQNRPAELKRLIGFVLDKKL